MISDCKIKDFDKMKELIKLCSSDNILKGFDKIEKECEALINESGIECIIADEELMNTVKSFFENSLNIAKTSKSTFMHRNTLIYRLEKIKHQTHLNIKDFNDAVVFNNILRIYEKIKNS